MASKIASKLVNCFIMRPKCMYLVNVRGLHLRGAAQSHKLFHQRKVVRIEKLRFPIVIKIREIKLTSPKQALNPLILIILRPLMKITGALFGRTIRKWWKSLSPEEKKIFLAKVRGKLKYIFLVAFLGIVVFIIYYFNHLYQTPITKRWRFMSVNDKTMIDLSDIQYNGMISEMKNSIVPKSHPFYIRTARVINHVILSNRDLPEIKSRNWDLMVIDAPEVVNAGVLPGGQIIVTTGILNMCSNDDQLAIVLSHEISHSILNHQAETLSQILLFDVILIIPSVICWAMFSDIWAFFSQLLLEKFAKILFKLPYSRILEKEADLVGLILSARACYDVREASVFWEKMRELTKEADTLEWLSTHPASAAREEDMKKMIPAAIKLRSDSDCPALRPRNVTPLLGGLIWRYD